MSNIGGVEEGGICHHIKDRAAEFNPPLHYALKMIMIMKICTKILCTFCK